MLQKAIDKYMSRKNSQQAERSTADHIHESESFKEEGNKHFRTGNFDEAIKCYTKALSVSATNPNNYIYYTNRATASFYHKDYTSAIDGALLPPSPPI